LLDIMMPGGGGLRAAETAGGFKTGLALARRIRSSFPNLPLAALTYSEDSEVQGWFRTHGAYFNKAQVKAIQLPRLLRRFLGDRNAPLKIFIIHGRDVRARRELEEYVQQTLGLGKPIILVEQPSGGRTIIEKFEEYAGDIDIVFVLATPDDLGNLATAPKTVQRRARQNVLFEYGYFLGALRRTTGRVLLLHKGPCELPSDIAGVVAIDINNGIAAAGAEIKRELRGWHPWVL
jgi:predicted nucleotide-binding protein